LLSSGKLIGFLFTTDYDRARDFFVNKLGCEFVSQDQFALAVTLGGSMIRISRIPDFTPAKGTVLGWEVKNIEAIADWLTTQGVTLERYPFIQDQERSIWTTPDGSKVAWFKDPDGNVLSVSEHF
jgi:catechol 2,3-dioxygenase-like lactoylglutathione lyase family enzyme